MFIIYTYIFFFITYFSSIMCQLIVNVKNNGGDVYRENISANTTQDTVSLEFRKADGTLVTQFIDGRNEVQIFKIVILPEEERGQMQVQTMCFVSRFVKSDFISSDAMSKLRQKNPSAIRHPEETRPSELIQLDLVLNVTTSYLISPHIAALCGDATETTYMSDSDLHLISQILNRDYQVLQTSARSTPIEVGTSCQLQSDPSQPCICHYDLCIGWYPCGLKYCRGKDSANRVVNYRCGIKTCSKCRNFEFLARKKMFCIWDEPEFLFESEIGTVTITRKSTVVSSELPVAPIRDTAQQGPEHDNVVRVADREESAKRSVNGHQPVVKMDQKVVSEEVKKVNPVVQNGGNSKPNIVGKNAQLDDDEDGE